MSKGGCFGCREGDDGFVLNKTTVDYKQRLRDATLAYGRARTQLDDRDSISSRNVAMAVFDEKHADSNRVGIASLGSTSAPFARVCIVRSSGSLGHEINAVALLCVWRGWYGQVSNQDRGFSVRQSPWSLDRKLRGFGANDLAIKGKIRRVAAHGQRSPGSYSSTQGHCP
jgi:hypothetical protein